MESGQVLGGSNLVNLLLLREHIGKADRLIVARLELPGVELHEYEHREEESRHERDTPAANRTVGRLAAVVQLHQRSKLVLSFEEV
eukprot:CAMPEP_0185567340 /NCGR_PEP_ID=MMETSP0434-20130131/643_1 /TAXON_ID=626734 ORGANISM="Favella taraikaensis, Strain Fe Narragansett Bay" /NCGR_SAMPLE_ID=MMETSP0434 /ASSEMBLY_ACC=CAM_ASM_000379 /LENGTH=85 /DNA_ID=CAMNT_0028181545 /DNA_START=1579 /DNA_END=1836 /DNA_ORIENTATION=-